MRRQISARSATGTCFHAFCAFVGAAERFFDRLAGGQLAREVNGAVDRRDGALNGGFHSRDFIVTSSLGFVTLRVHSRRGFDSGFR